MGLRTARALLTAAIAAVFVLGACAENDEDPDTGVAQEIELEAYDYYFEETSLMFDLGARVTIDFVNAGGTTHSFTADDLDIDVEAQSGEATEITFEVPSEPGVFDFFCKYHPDDMSGTISIGGGEEPIDEEPDTEQDGDGDADVEVEVDTDNDAGGGAGNDY